MLFLLGLYPPLTIFLLHRYHRIGRSYSNLCIIKYFLLLSATINKICEETWTSGSNIISSTTAAQSQWKRSTVLDRAEWTLRGYVLRRRRRKGERDGHMWKKCVQFLKACYCPSHDWTGQGRAGLPHTKQSRVCCSLLGRCAQLGRVDIEWV